MEPPVPLIVCFGDSLTVGYQSPTAEYPVLQETPYGVFLQEYLGPRARVVISGVCGELTGEMAMRFRRDVLDRSPAFVVVLGGSNDLGWNARQADIMRNLLKLHELALAAGIRPVAVTVPSIRAGSLEDNAPSIPGVLEARCPFEVHVRRRLDLNRWLSEYCTSRGIACVDLFTATAEPGTLQLAEPYSNDGLHLSTDGYRLLAQLLYEQVFAVKMKT